MLIILTQPDLFEAADDVSLYKSLFFNFLLGPRDIFQANIFRVRLGSGKCDRFENGFIFNTYQSLGSCSDPNSVAGNMNNRDQGVRMLFAKSLENIYKI